MSGCPMFLPTFHAANLPLLSFFPFAINNFLLGPFISLPDFRPHPACGHPVAAAAAGRAVKSVVPAALARVPCALRAPSDPGAAAARAEAEGAVPTGPEASGTSAAVNAEADLATRRSEGRTFTINIRS